MQMVFTFRGIVLSHRRSMIPSAKIGPFLPFTREKNAALRPVEPAIRYQNKFQWHLEVNCLGRNTNSPRLVQGSAGL